MYFSYDLADDIHNDRENRDGTMNTERADGMTPVSTNIDSNQLNAKSAMEGDSCDLTGYEDITASSPMLSTGYDNSAASNTAINGEEACENPDSSEYSLSSTFGLNIDLETESSQNYLTPANQINTYEIVGDNADANLVHQEDDTNIMVVRGSNGIMGQLNSPIFWEPLQIPKMCHGRRQPRTNLSQHKKKILSLCTEYQNAFPKMTLTEIAKMIHDIDYPHIPQRAIRNAIYKYRNERKHVYKKN